ncbi:MAG: methyltransferase domain-containing protein, partial [Candidatus Omnitrophota bacterium]
MEYLAHTQPEYSGKKDDILLIDFSFNKIKALYRMRDRLSMIDVWQQEVDLAFQAMAAEYAPYFSRYFQKNGLDYTRDILFIDIIGGFLKDSISTAEFLNMMLVGSGYIQRGNFHHIAGTGHAGGVLDDPRWDAVHERYEYHEHISSAIWEFWVDTHYRSGRDYIIEIVNGELRVSYYDCLYPSKPVNTYQQWLSKREIYLYFLRDAAGQQDGGSKGIRLSFTAGSSGRITCVDGACCFMRSPAGFTGVRGMSGSSGNIRGPTAKADMLLLYYPFFTLRENFPLEKYIIRWSCAALAMVLDYAPATGFTFRANCSRYATRLSDCSNYQQKLNDDDICLCEQHVRRQIALYYLLRKSSVTKNKIITSLGPDFQSLSGILYTKRAFSMLESDIFRPIELSLTSGSAPERFFVFNPARDRDVSIYNRQQAYLYRINNGSSDGGTPDKVTTKLSEEAVLKALDGHEGWFFRLGSPIGPGWAMTDRLLAGLNSSDERINTISRRFAAKLLCEHFCDQLLLEEYPEWGEFIYFMEEILSTVTDAGLKASVQQLLDETRMFVESGMTELMPKGMLGSRLSEDAINYFEIGLESVYYELLKNARYDIFIRNAIRDLYGVEAPVCYIKIPAVSIADNAALVAIEEGIIPRRMKSGTGYCGWGIFEITPREREKSVSYGESPYGGIHIRHKISERDDIILGGSRPLDLAYRMHKHLDRGWNPPQMLTAEEEVINSVQRLRLDIDLMKKSRGEAVREIERFLHDRYWRFSTGSTNYYEKWGRDYVDKSKRILDLIYQRQEEGWPGARISGILLNAETLDEAFRSLLNEPAASSDSGRKINKRAGKTEGILDKLRSILNGDPVDSDKEQMPLIEKNAPDCRDDGGEDVKKRIDRINALMMVESFGLVLWVWGFSDVFVSEGYPRLMGIFLTMGVVLGVCLVPGAVFRLYSYAMDKQQKTDLFYKTLEVLPTLASDHNASRKLIEFIGLKSSHPMLLIYSGCGSRVPLLEEIKNKYPLIKAVGIDCSSYQISLARKSLGIKNDPEHIRFIEGFDYAGIPLAEGSAGKIVVECMQHTSYVNSKKAFAEYSRLLDNGGELIIGFLDWSLYLHRLFNACFGVASGIMPHLWKEKDVSVLAGNNNLEEVDRIAIESIGTRFIFYRFRRYDRNTSVEFRQVGNNTDGGSVKEHRVASFPDGGSVKEHRVASLKDGGKAEAYRVASLRDGGQVAVLKKYGGANLISDNGQQLVFLMCRHNWAYPAWWLGLRKLGIKSAAVIHVDFHHDLWPNFNTIWLPSNEQEVIGQAAANEVDISNFIEPAIRQSLISEIYWCSRFGAAGDQDLPLFEGYEYLRVLGKGLGLARLPDFSQGSKRLILDIDLDFFACYKRMADENGVYFKADILDKDDEYRGVLVSPVIPGEKEPRQICFGKPGSLNSEENIKGEICSSIKKAVQTLSAKGVKPAIVTIARSPGYTPGYLINFIADTLLEELVKGAIIPQVFRSPFLTGADGGERNIPDINLHARNFLIKGLSSNEWMGKLSSVIIRSKNNDRPLPCLNIFELIMGSNVYSNRDEKLSRIAPFDPESYLYINVITCSDTEKCVHYRVMIAQKKAMGTENAELLN